MNQIVMNLVINAAEAIGEHTGTIRVRTSLETLDARAIQQRLPTYEPSPGQYVCLEVSDTGVGMDAETMTRIFDPFFTTKFMGRGLGLAALQGIVRGHRGAVEVRSAPNAGTTFRIFLPAAEQRTADATRPPSAARADGATVLVIDDAPDVRAVAKGMLEEEGCVVHLASTGLEGVERFARLARGVDVVLLDVAMPIMSGEETLTALRRIRADVPVVVMSGYGDLETMQRFEGARVTGFLQKPFTPEQLAAKVREALKADSD
jgi:CheY-like chemotaxis protein